MVSFVRRDLAANGLAAYTRVRFDFLDNGVGTSHGVSVAPVFPSGDQETLDGAEGQENLEGVQ